MASLATAIASGFPATIQLSTPLEITVDPAIALADGFEASVTFGVIIPPDQTGSGGGGGGGGYITYSRRERRVIEKLLDKAFAKPEESDELVEELLPEVDPVRVEVVVQALISRSDTATKAHKQQVATLLKKLQVREQELAEEEKVIALLLLS